jgi:lysophospholipase L1-like esterase
MKYRLGSFSLLLGMLLLIFLIDRALLAKLGLPLWKSDPILHYKHRPETIRNWGKRFDNNPIYINQHGFHDDNFPAKKVYGELRGLIIGDSIVMGHGVAASETFANQLERMLPKNVPGYDLYQVINTGVQGYSTFQYLEMLKRSMKFSPDFIAIGFCMNDVTEPYIVNRSYGGSGLDYHRILQVSHPWIDYLVNETGFGRLSIYIRMKIKKKFPSADELKRKEIYNVRKMAKSSRTDPVYIEAWKHVLSDLSEIYELANNENIPVLLIIFPYTFQLGHKELQIPQKILRQHADLHGVSYLDMTQVVEGLVADGVPLDSLFLDGDHYTVKGHSVIAHSLIHHLKANDMLRTASITGNHVTE